MAILASIDIDQDYERVLEISHDLAEAYDDELVVLYVMPNEVYETKRENFLDTPEHTEYPASQAERESSKRTERLAEEALGEDVEFRAEARVGDVTPEIISVAESNDARYVVIGGRKRTPAGKALFGSITQSVLLNADRPVVTVMEDRG